MKFLMLVCEDPDADPYDPRLDTIEAWVTETTASGQRLEGQRVRPAAETRVVTVRAGTTQVTLGPSAPPRTPVAGFDLLDCEDWDAAIAVAARHPMARFGRLELRAYWPFEA